MDYKAFFTEILGELGSKALDNTNEVLKPVIVPRAILSWVTVVGNLGYDGELPGIPDSYISLHKSESGTGYSGALKIDDGLLIFGEDASLSHIAASVGVALDIQLPDLNEKLKQKDLTGLGKSIDLLIKSEFVKKNNKKKKKLEKGDSAKSGGAGPAAAPTAPKAPTAPSAANLKPQMSPKGKVIVKPPVAIGQGQQGEAQKLKMTKSEASRSCSSCGNSFFTNNQFTGCSCTQSLAKITKTERNPDGYTLVFQAYLDEEVLESIVSLLKE